NQDTFSGERIPLQGWELQFSRALFRVALQLAVEGPQVLNEMLPKLSDQLEEIIKSAPEDIGMVEQGSGPQVLNVLPKLSYQLKDIDIDSDSDIDSGVKSQPLS